MSGPQLFWGMPLPTPPLTDIHTHWPVWVVDGLLELFPGDFRSWLSSWRSRFSSHMSTQEALWEAFCGGPGGTGRPTQGLWLRSVPHLQASQSSPYSARLVPILWKRKLRLHEVGWTPKVTQRCGRGLCHIGLPTTAAPAG